MPLRQDQGLIQPQPLPPDPNPNPTGLWPRLVAWRVLEAVGDGAYADLALERELRRQPLSPLDRGLATELAYGAIRQRRQLDGWLDRHGKVPANRQPPRLRWLLHVGLQQLLAMDRVPASAAVSTAVELAKRQRLASLAPVVNGLLRSAARAIEAGEKLQPPTDPILRLAFEQSLPDWLVQELWQQLGPERCTALAVASNETPSLDLRVNPLRSNREAVLAAFSAAGCSMACCRASSSCASLTDRAALVVSAASTMAVLATWMFSSTSFSTPSKAFWVRPKRVSTLALWAATICSAVR